MRYDRPAKTYDIYILSSKSRTIYVGLTGRILRRMWQHKRKIFKGFTAKYNIDRLVYRESFSYVWDAIHREKEIKGWRRSKKAALIENANPTWQDLSDGWMDWSLDFEKY
jgi:putative endonuclease